LPKILQCRLAQYTMFSDRAPFEYRYLSRRLLRDLFEHDGATRRRWGFKVSLSAAVASLELSRSAPDESNLHYLASRAEQLVSDHTGQLSHLGGCMYLKDRLDLRFGVFPGLRGWRGGQVACYTGVADTEDGPVFVALFGSASNVVGFRDEGGSGFYPSDLSGICDLLDLVREPADPPVDEDLRWDEGDMSTDGRVSAIFTLARGGAVKRIGEHEVLAKLFFDRDDVSDDNFAGRVVVGTPLWVATTRPTRPLDSSPQSSTGAA
jgi:hypothetical protein